MQPTLTIHGITFAPPLFCAPMAGITHSAFRRLVADFGGYGALYTELNASKQVLREDPATSTFLKRRPEEGNVIYQLLVTGSDNLSAVVERIAALNPAGIDINCGCGAREILEVGGGAALFEDPLRLETVLRTIRREYPGLLTVKARLGKHRPDWQEHFVDRLSLLEDCGVDALAIHPRFDGQYRRKAANHASFDWVARQTRLPLIANGDITGPQVVAAHPDRFERVAGIMVGRMAAAQPWIFAAWNQPDFKVDYLETWTRFFRYLLEDFTPRQALIPLKLFTKYYAQNFVYGHTFFSAIRTAPDVDTIRERAVRFLADSPPIDPCPAVSGI